MTSADRIVQLKSISWGDVGLSKNRTDVDETNEFLRRAATFLRKRNVHGQTPFFNMAEILGLTVSHELKLQIDEIVSTTEFVLAKRIGLNYVLTSGIEDASEIYVPLISVFQRGGFLDYHHGEVIVDDEWAIPLGNWIDRL